MLKEIKVQGLEYIYIMKESCTMLFISIAAEGIKELTHESIKE